MESLLVLSDVDAPEQRTFYRDEMLPPLPLPRLEDTLTKYLESCRPGMLSHYVSTLMFSRF